MQMSTVIAPSMTKIQRHPLYPRRPFTFPPILVLDSPKVEYEYAWLGGGGREGFIHLLFPMAEASSPPNAPAKDVEQKKKVKRFCASERLYHMPSK